MTQVNDTLNNTMDTKIIESNKRPEKKPDETSGLLFEARVKIFDPETGDVIVEGRA